MLKRYSAYAFSLLLLGGIGLVGCESTSSPKPVVQQLEQVTITKSPNDDRQYAALMLPNGLQVVLVSDPSLENSSASLAVGVGSAHDPKDQLGLAHYLEHMLFLGTEKYPEPDGFMKYTQANGGMTNAFTAYDKTNYMFQINAGKFDEALDRFSDYFKKPTFDPHFSDKERNAVNNEWSLQKAQDNWNLYALQGYTANPHSPSAKFTIGNLDTLKDKPGSVLNDEMKKFYNTYYSSNIMKLALVGKQSLPELKALAEKHFAAIPNKNVTLPEITTPGLTKNEMGKSIHYKPIKELKVLYVDFPVKSNKTQWRLKPNQFIHSLLTSEEPGTLGEQLRAQGLVKTLTAYFDAEAYGPDGFLRVQADLTDAGLQKQDEVIAAIFAYVDVIKRKGLDKNYYRELQAMRTKDFANAPKPDPLQQAVGLAISQFDLPVENLMNSEYIYERYDEKSINAVLSQLEEKRARIWYVNPNEKADTPVPFFDGVYSIRDITGDEYKRWESLKKNYAFNLPPLNDLFTDTQAPIVDNTYLKPHQVVSQAGVEAFLVHPEFYREDKGKLALQINVDFAMKSPREAVLASLVNDIYAKQTMTLSDRAGRASLGISTSVMDAVSQGIFISGYTTKHPQLLQKMLNEFVTLDISDKHFHEAMDSFQQGMSNKKKNHVFRQLFGHAQRLISKTPWTDEQILAAAEKITKADVIAYHQAVKADPLLRLLAVGNYTDAQVRAMAEAAAAILPGKRLPESRAVNQYVTPAAGKVVSFNDDVELADSALLQAWFGSAKSDDEQAQLAVLNSLFGNDFFMQLRTHEQLGYVVTSFNYPVDDIPGFVMLVQSSNTDLPGIKARMDKFRKEYLAKLKTTDEAEIEQAKQALIANALEKPSDFYSEADRYSGEFWHGKYAFDGRDRYLAALNKVTKADVIKIYESLLLNEKAGKGLLQLRGTNFKAKPFAH
ncbi:insulinase family protein [Cellvibrio sp. pealriver]|uniref:insulinase family protein n=1 Tax=Cellvibrio sp. pealriver TaxID=1622269 RepID=UPI00066FF55C|nr:insulinase family protein [Cellvibrio sp. pealriver]